MSSIAAKITRRSGSNLVLALRLLPPDKRSDARIFYAFCRVVDDLADDKALSVERKREGLQRWLWLLENNFEGAAGLEREVGEMIVRTGIPIVWLLEILEGCTMDLLPQRFGTWDELAVYCRRVAGAVGLVSTRLFGCVHEDSERYALALGNALQLTNILRDVGEDLLNGVRIYLPLADLMRFQYDERDLIGRVYDSRFIALMSYQAERAQAFFAEARALMPALDARALRPARMMADLYQALLEQLRASGFRVFTQRERLGFLKKASIFGKHLVAR